VPDPSCPLLSLHQQVRNTFFSCGAGCVNATVLARDAAADPNYAFLCASNGITATAPVGFTCSCPQFFTGDPLYGECQLPPAILYTIPSTANVTTDKPESKKGQFYFLNGGDSKALSWYVWLKSSSYTNGTRVLPARVNYTWQPQTNATLGGRETLNPCGNQVIEQVDIDTRGKDEVLRVLLPLSLYTL
jgi:hypothetical protein